MLYPHLRYHLFDFCNGEIMQEKRFKNKDELIKFIDNNSLEEPKIIYGIDVTKKFIKKEKIIC